MVAVQGWATYGLAQEADESSQHRKHAEFCSVTPPLHRPSASPAVQVVRAPFPSSLRYRRRSP